MKSSFLFTVVFLALLAAAVSSASSNQEAPGQCFGWGETVSSILTAPMYYLGYIIYCINYPLIWLCSLFMPVVVFVIWCLCLVMGFLWMLSSGMVLPALFLALIGAMLNFGVEAAWAICSAVASFVSGTICGIFASIWSLLNLMSLINYVLDLFPILQGEAAAYAWPFAVGLVLYLCLKGEKSSLLEFQILPAVYVFWPSLSGVLACFLQLLLGLVAGAESSGKYWMALSTYSFAD